MEVALASGASLDGNVSVAGDDRHPKSSQFCGPVTAAQPRKMSSKRRSLRRTRSECVPSSVTNTKTIGTVTQGASDDEVEGFVGTIVGLENDTKPFLNPIATMAPDETDMTGKDVVVDDIGDTSSQCAHSEIGPKAPRVRMRPPAIQQVKIKASIEKARNAVRFGKFISQSTDTRSLVILLFQIMFSGCMNGFLSFSIIPLGEVEGFSTVMIGALIPCSSVANIVCNLLVGSWQGKVAHKALFAVASFCTGLGSFCCSSGVFILMLLGFGLCGAGLGIMGVLPFVQCKLYGGENDKLYQRWYMLMNVGLACTFGAGRIYMAAATVAVGGKWGWRLPWLMVGAIQSLIFALILTRHYMGPVHAVKRVAIHLAALAILDEKKIPKHGLFETVKHFYLESPLSLMHVLAYPFLAFSQSSIAIWYPVIARELYPGVEEEARTLFTLCCLLISAPVGLFVTGVLLSKMQRIKSAVRANWVAALISFISLLILILVPSFSLFCVELTIYVVSQYFPFFFVKQMPFTIGLTGNVSVFAVSQFVVLYTIFGDVSGSLVFGAIAQVTSYRAAALVALCALWIGLGIFSVLLVQSFRPKGIVYERVQEEAHERALAHWDKVRQHVLPTSKQREGVNLKVTAIQRARTVGSCRAMDMAEIIVVGAESDKTHASGGTSVPEVANREDCGSGGQADMGVRSVALSEGHSTPEATLRRPRSMSTE